jgi:hypothetical protein
MGGWFCTDQRRNTGSKRRIRYGTRLAIGQALVIICGGCTAGNKRFEARVLDYRHFSTPMLSKCRLGRTAGGMRFDDLAVCEE